MGDLDSIMRRKDDRIAAANDRIKALEREREGLLAVSKSMLQRAVRAERAYKLCESQFAMLRAVLDVNNCPECDAPPTAEHLQTCSMRQALVASDVNEGVLEVIGAVQQWCRDNRHRYDFTETERRLLRAVKALEEL